MGVYRDIVVGSTNQVKINAVKEVLAEFPDIMKSDDVMPIKADSGVSDQPIGFDQIISGAKNRAKMAFEEARPDLAIGIEDGIAEVPHTDSGYLNFCASVAYDGRRFFVGMSGGYEYPKDVVRHIMDDGLNVTESFIKLGLVDDRNIGAEEGAIGVMSKGRENRIDGTKYALRRALIKLDNKDVYD